MFKNISLVLGSLILSTSMVFAAPKAAEIVKPEENKGSEVVKPGEGPGKANSAIAIIRAAGGAKSTTGTKRNAVTEGQSRSAGALQSRSQGQVEADKVSGSKLGTASVVSVSAEQPTVTAKTSGKEAKAVDKIERALGVRGLKAVAAIKGLDAPTQQAVAVGVSARVEAGTLSAEVANSVLEANAKVFNYLGVDGGAYLNRAIGAGKECAEIGVEEGKSIEEQSVPLANLAKSLEGVEALAPSSDVAVRLRNVAELQASNFEKMGLANGAQRVRALGGKAVSEDGIVCNIGGPVAAAIPANTNGVAALPMAAGM